MRPKAGFAAPEEGFETGCLLTLLISKVSVAGAYASRCSESCRDPAAACKKRASNAFFYRGLGPGATPHGLSICNDMRR